ncbi:MAG: STAS domain-containing protein [Bdellovibrionia bacterium]
MKNLPQSAISNPTSEEIEAYRIFWVPYEAHYDEIQLDVLAEAKKIPQFEKLISSIPPQMMVEQNKINKALMRGAILDGKWDDFINHQRSEGVKYAKMGLAFPLWFELLTSFRRSLNKHIIIDYKNNSTNLNLALEGMNRFVDVSMAIIGDAYLNTKEEIISTQQRSILELSTPVLQFRDRLLIIPIIGMVDTHRARQLTENLLNKVRDNRAKVVVMDITGVATVDSKVANHIIQTVEAASLMGATVILTGISPTIAQTLVILGAEMRGAITVGDLQGGIEVAEKLLGLKVIGPTTAERPVSAEKA